MFPLQQQADVKLSMLIHGAAEAAIFTRWLRLQSVHSEGNVIFMFRLDLLMCFWLLVLLMTTLTYCSVTSCSFTPWLAHLHHRCDGSALRSTTPLTHARSPAVLTHAGRYWEVSRRKCSFTCTLVGIRAWVKVAEDPLAFQKLWKSKHHFL